MERRGVDCFVLWSAHLKTLSQHIWSPIEGHSIFNSTKKLCLLEVYYTAKFGQFHAVEENNSWLLRKASQTNQRLHCSPYTYLASDEFIIICNQSNVLSRWLSGRARTYVIGILQFSKSLPYNANHKLVPSLHINEADQSNAVLSRRSSLRKSKHWRWVDKGETWRWARQRVELWTVYIG